MIIGSEEIFVKLNSWEAKAWSWSRARQDMKLEAHRISMTSRFYRRAHRKTRDSNLSTERLRSAFRSAGMIRFYFFYESQMLAQCGWQHFITLRELKVFISQWISSTVHVLTKNLCKAQMIWTAYDLKSARIFIILWADMIEDEYVQLDETKGGILPPSGMSVNGWCLMNAVSGVQIVNWINKKLEDSFHDKNCWTGISWLY